MNERVLVSLFCDDIRHEVGNKFSLIGCYGDQVVVEKLPALLGKLCVHARAMTPADRPFKKLVFRAFLNEEPLAEVVIPQEQLTQAEQQSKALEKGVFWSTVAIMAFSPLTVSESARLRIEAETEEGVLNGGFIVLRERRSDELIEPRLH